MGDATLWFGRRLPVRGPRHNRESRRWWRTISSGAVNGASRWCPRAMSCPNTFLTAASVSIWDD